MGPNGPLKAWKDVQKYWYHLVFLRAYFLHCGSGRAGKLTFLLVYKKYACSVSQNLKIMFSWLRGFSESMEKVSASTNCARDKYWRKIIILQIGKHYPALARLSAGRNILKKIILSVSVGHASAPPPISSN